MKHKKPYTIEFRYFNWLKEGWTDWSVMNRYKTEGARDQAFGVLLRKDADAYFEIRKGKQ